MFFIDFLAGIGKKLYICSRNWLKNLPIYPTKTIYYFVDASKMVYCY